MEMTIERVEPSDSGMTCLQIRGAIDLTSRQGLLDAGLEVLSGASLTLDLDDVEFIDSVGIGAVIELARIAETRGRDFLVSGRSARVERVLTATGLHDAWR